MGYHGKLVTKYPGSLVYFSVDAEADSSDELVVNCFKSTLVLVLQQGWSERDARLSCIDRQILVYLDW